jgi:hypothetical protein
LSAEVDSRWSSEPAFHGSTFPCSHRPPPPRPYSLSYVRPQ